MARKEWVQREEEHKQLLWEHSAGMCTHVLCSCVNLCVENKILHICVYLYAYFMCVQGMGAEGGGTQTPLVGA